MPRLSVDGLDLHYALRDGPDPPVLFLHGLGSSSDDWAPQLPAFETRYRLILADLRGHGRSARLRGRLTVEAMAGDVEQLLAHLGVGPAHVVGLSLGACVGLILALRAPARVRSLTLVNGFARLAPAGPRGVARLLARLGLALVAPMETVAAHVARGLFPKPEQHALYHAAVTALSANSRRAYLAALRAVAAFDVRAQLAGVRCPALIVAGDRDTTVPLAAKRLLERSLPDARLLVVGDSGHATNHDQADAFNHAVLDFIARH